ncbi:VpaChn25_0724 family phage protein [Sinorhizobium fredii]
MSIETIIKEEARLIILKELSNQPNQSITSEAMRRFLLSDFLIDKPREWVEMEFQYLQHMEAVEIIPAGSVKIARLTERGELHVKGMVTIAGVQRPSRIGA